METQFEKITAALEYAGCPADKAAKLLEAGMQEDLIHHMRLCRCEKMDDLHRIQKQIDCLDALIRQMKKKD
ncbi:MAG: hypothetical protein IKS37_01405 [Solobacterium sp.]|nr:hypothetical protein [Solobacterium sp.]